MFFISLRLIAYIRVSTKDQEKAGSYKTQEQQIEQWAKQNNYSIVDTFQDLAVTGSVLERPEFQKMLESLKKVDGLVFVHTDRFSRADPIETIIIQRQIFSLKKRIFSVIEGEITEETLEQLLLTFIGSYSNAQYIKIAEEKRIAGMKRKMVELKAEGKNWGRPRKKFNIKQYLELREKGILKSNIARIFGMSHDTLNRHLKWNKIGDIGPKKNKEKRKNKK